MYCAPWANPERWPDIPVCSSFAEGVGIHALWGVAILAAIWLVAVICTIVVRALRPNPTYRDNIGTQMEAVLASDEGVRIEVRRVVRQELSQELKSHSAGIVQSVRASLPGWQRDIAAKGQ